MKAQLRIGFQGRGKIKTCSRAHVQSVDDGVQLALGITGQAHPLGQVLAQQAIGAFARATLPRHMRIGKEYLDREVVRQPLVPQRSAWQHRQASLNGFLREVFAHVVRIRAAEPSGNLFR